VCACTASQRAGESGSQCGTDAQCTCTGAGVVLTRNLRATASLLLLRSGSPLHLSIKHELSRSPLYRDSSCQGNQSIQQNSSCRYNELHTTVLIQVDEDCNMYITSAVLHALAQGIRFITTRSCTSTGINSSSW
jgi:hypothetical protein